MLKQPKTRRHAFCPYCKFKPVIKIWEHSEKIDDVWYIRHINCLNCGKLIELTLHEYYKDGLFQRQVNFRNPIEIEDLENKKKQRIIEIYPQ